MHQATVLQPVVGHGRHDLEHTLGRVILVEARC